VLFGKAESTLRTLPRGMRRRGDAASMPRTVALSVVMRSPAEDEAPARKRVLRKPALIASQRQALVRWSACSLEGSALRGVWRNSEAVDGNVANPVEDVDGAKLRAANRTRRRLITRAMDASGAERVAASGEGYLREAFERLQAERAIVPGRLRYGARKWSEGAALCARRGPRPTS